MGVIVLDGNRDEELKEIIAICKSSSCSSGAKLRKAHYRAGEKIADLIVKNEKLTGKVAIVIMMRAGLPFGLGIADRMEECGLFIDVFFSNVKISELNPDDYEKIIFVDAVIRTGNEISESAQSVAEDKKVIFAANVLDYTGVSRFSDKTLYAVRVSENSYKGTAQKKIEGGKGPDTGDRLFFSAFYQ